MLYHATSKSSSIIYLQDDHQLGVSTASRNTSNPPFSLAFQWRTCPKLEAEEFDTPGDDSGESTMKNEGVNP